MRPEGCSPNCLSYVAALKACSCLASREEAREAHGPSGKVLVRFASLEKAREIHREVDSFGGCQDLDIKLPNTLISVYAKCGSLVDAFQVFQRMPSHSLVSWTVLILGYAENGQGEVALSLFATMKSKGCDPDCRTFVAAIRACTSLAAKEEFKLLSQEKLVKVAALEKGREVYVQAVESGSSDKDIFVANAALDMFLKCGSLEDARQVFERIQRPDVVSWTTLIAGYSENREPELALELFQRMQLQRCSPNGQALVAVVKACIALAAMETGQKIDGKVVKTQSLEKGMAIHAMAVSQFYYDADVFLASSLVEMYARCGSLLDARKVFDRIVSHDSVLWTALVLGYADNGEEEIALELFRCMNSRRCTPDCRTYVAALKACAGKAAREEGTEIYGKLVKRKSLEVAAVLHAEVAERGLETDVFVASSLVDLYAKCWSMVEARRVFDRIPRHRRDVVLWTALTLGHAENGEEGVALDLVGEMQSQGSVPNWLTFVAALKACTGLAGKERELGNHGKKKFAALERGRDVHSQAVKCCCDSNVFVASSLIDMYAHCGSMEEARRVFLGGAAPQHLVSWTSLVLGYARNGEEALALEAFTGLRPQGCVPDTRAIVAALKACIGLAEKEDGIQVDRNFVKLAALEKGMAVHSEAAAKCPGDLKNTFVASSLIDFYVKCGSMGDARRVFDTMPDLGLVLWSTLMLGYADDGEGDIALELYKLVDKNYTPDAQTLAAALTACARVVSLQAGKEIHSEIYRRGLEGDGVLATCLVDFYGKCGRTEEAQLVFDSRQGSWDVVTWTSLIAGYSRVGDTKVVFERFGAMVDEGLGPNHVTFVSVLTVCSRAGLVEKGRSVFAAMESRYGVKPSEEHYVCMVDLLGRARMLEEALEVVESRPRSGMAWMVLLGACHKWRDVKHGRIAFEALVVLDPENSAAYDLMSNIYMSFGKNFKFRKN
ncbi:pentatricopeptide repeat-containing protein At2g03380, mitochondrial-like isoform X1 [Selaginella moellendorffii]|uniref:pentatricopeptide repeat-containing protein At2g03380, mitochondrial-like isoform X1 n=1 Tax=Selaginella moellendorffii TaxID=88036 RepID=UPI000D1C758B|nr:pentatricopeptide repeat-containing protein At2g03380, mitochondrial-like isoform X1 [Selaginella moellendorffii]|eukprot:XP_024534057.1 pentatricopeptide repeat-containing protein At2g03380, mitochondrial-like isoform X1 [Selaginella moellendorffii]